jgi:predicted O-methyltransferase YrrM
MAASTSGDKHDTTKLVVAASAAAAVAGIGIGFLLGSFHRDHRLRDQKSSGMADWLYEYVCKVGTQETPQHVAIRELTAKMPERLMQISPDQGQFLSNFTKATGAKTIVEVGTFTGYSALCFATALPPGGQLHVFDISDKFVAKGRPHWRAAGVSARVKEHIGDARALLAAEVATRGSGWADIVFIDADKTSYDVYVELALTALRPGGALLIDNMLWFGRVARPRYQDDDTVALRNLNAKLHADPRVDYSILPLGDGVGFAVKL